MRNHSLIAAMALTALAGLGEAAAALPAPRKGSSRDYKPRRVAVLDGNGDLAREIAEHNAEVDRRKAEKRQAKMGRRALRA